MKKVILTLAMGLMAGATPAAKITASLLPSLPVYSQPSGGERYEVASNELQFPIQILGTSENGRLKIRLQGKNYWVKPGHVEYDTEAEHVASCPKIQGAVLIASSRGAGNEVCK